MRIGDYQIIDGPMPGWDIPKRHGRSSIGPVLDGVVGQVYPGSPGDEITTLRWGEVLNADPARTLLVSYTGHTATISINTLERYAWLYTPADFEAVSSARLLLQRTAPVTGYITVEAWSRVAAGPVEKIGVIGYIDVEEIDTVAHEAKPFWGLSAWPLDADTGGYIVLNGDNMLGAGSIEWHVAVVADTTYLYTAGAWGVAAGRRPVLYLYEGGPFSILRGLTGAYQAAGGSGPPTYEIDLEDGQLYDGVLLDIDGRPVFGPMTVAGDVLASRPCTDCYMQRPSLSIGITGEL